MDTPTPLHVPLEPELEHPVLQMPRAVARAHGGVPLDLSDVAAQLLDQDGCAKHILDQDACAKHILDQDGCAKHILDQDACAKRILDGLQSQDQ